MNKPSDLTRMIFFALTSPRLTNYVQVCDAYSLEKKSLLITQSRIASLKNLVALFGVCAPRWEPQL
ncbi:hypothetical protein SK128_020065 [Halocaridina rubra]|uniref:Uncharacterized protein n=1 Tax=Halocaridina rubra TaxID=373956 RepID=A0AAN8WLY6_HALRR